MTTPENMAQANSDLLVTKRVTRSTKKTRQIATSFCETPEAVYHTPTGVITRSMSAKLKALSRTKTQDAESTPKKIETSVKKTKIRAAQLDYESEEADTPKQVNNRSENINIEAEKTTTPEITEEKTTEPETAEEEPRVVETTKVKEEYEVLEVKKEAETAEQQTDPMVENQQLPTPIEKKKKPFKLIKQVSMNSSLSSSSRVLVYQNRRSSLNSSKPRASSTRKPFVSLAEAILKFQNSTPSRFRTTPNFPDPTQSSPLQLTNPVSPVLRAKSRTRKTPLSTEEREIQEVEKFRKNTIAMRKITFKKPESSKVMANESPEVCMVAGTDDGAAAKVLHSRISIKENKTPKATSMAAFFSEQRKKELQDWKEQKKLKSQSRATPAPEASKSRDSPFLNRTMKDELANFFSEQEKNARANPVPDFKLMRESLRDNLKKSIESNTLLKKTGVEEREANQQKRKMPEVGAAAAVPTKIPTLKVKLNMAKKAKERREF